MIKKISLFISLLVMGLMLTACRTQPILNLYNQPVPQGLTAAQVKESIQDVSKVKGWHVVQVKPGLLKASIKPRGHYAEVSIPYSTNKYDILYRNSHDLLYNKQQKTIHRAYNRWVLNLNQKIQKELDLAKHKHKS